MRLRRRGLETSDPRSSQVVEEYKIGDMAEKVQLLKQTATELKRISGGIQAVDRNVDRILASIKMLEINVSDILDIAG
jgi:hypothetical protein